MSTLVEMPSVYVNLKESTRAPQLVALEPLIDDIAHELDMPDDVHPMVNAPEPPWSGLLRLSYCRERLAPPDTFMSRAISYRPLAAKRNSARSSADWVA